MLFRSQRLRAARDRELHLSSERTVALLIEHSIPFPRWRLPFDTGAGLPGTPAVKLTATRHPQISEASELRAFGNALPNATAYHLGMSADAHEKPDILMPADVIAGPLMPALPGARHSRNSSGTSSALTRGGSSVTPLRTASGYSC